jgi:hypothetical protein
MKYDRFMLTGGPLEIPGGGYKIFAARFFFSLTSLQDYKYINKIEKILKISVKQSL